MERFLRWVGEGLSLPCICILLTFHSCFSHPKCICLCICRLKELREARTCLQFSQTWEENIYMERKGCPQEVHSSVHCLELWHNGISQRNLITRKDHTAIKICFFDSLGKHWCWEIKLIFIYWLVHS